jgi:succinate dehydrogenase flavin-adding protein (antitoxin of CptAB toxin-antitoxin module)
MKYQTVVTAAENLGAVPHMYYISQADEQGEPVQMGQLARIRFATDEAGCAEADLIGIVMHRLSVIAQDGEHRHYERALQCLDAALKNMGETLEVAEVQSDLDLTRLASESV